MNDWRKSDGNLFFSGISSIENSDNILVVGDDIYYALMDLHEHMPFATILGYTFNHELCENLKDLVQDVENVIITDNEDDIMYMLYEYGTYGDSLNTLVFPGTLSYIRTSSTKREFDELLEDLISLKFDNIILYDSFCYKSFSQLTPLELYFSVLNDENINKDMLRTYELFYGSIMYYINFIRFFIKYKKWEEYDGHYDWIDILDDCQELSINWNDLVRKIVKSGYQVKYINMAADKATKDYIERKINHSIKVATQTRAVFTAKDSYYAG